MVEGDPSKTILLAVSGGIDSMCMANLFINSKYRSSIAIAHVNFSLRGEESNLDQILVKQWAESMNLVFHTTDFDTSTYSQKKSISTQMAARELRYNWFYSLMQEYSYEYLAIAHNMNDSVETLFLNILRGTGIKGLSGIKRVNDKIIRPLIDITRAEIEDYMNSNSFSYREDETNKESYYSRNRLRNVVFPEFEKINPSFLSTAYRNINHFIQASEVLDELFELKKNELSRFENDELVIPIAYLQNEKYASYWLYRILSPYGFNHAQLAQISDSLEGETGKVFHSLSHELLIDRGNIRVYSREDQSSMVLEITEPGEYEFNGTKFIFELFLNSKEFRPRPKEGQLFFDADRVVLPMVAREWRTADKFRPFGMSRGSKLLSDFFTDLKLSKRDKAKQTIILNGEDIVSVLGKRIDDRYKVRSSTRIIAELRIL